MPPNPSRSRSQVSRPPEGEIWPTSVIFKPIVPADRTQARCYMLEQRGPTRSVIFAPFTLPSVDSLGSLGDCLPADADSEDEAIPNLQDRAPSPRQAASKEASPSAAPSREATPRETKPTATPPGALTNRSGNGHSPKMGFSGNPLAYPSEAPSAFAVAANRPNLRESNSNSNGNNMMRSSRVRATPARGQDTGLGALLRGEYFAQSRRNVGDNAGIVKRNIIDLTSDIEDEDCVEVSPPCSNQRPTAARSSSHKHSLAFILNNSPRISPASVPPVAQERQPASSPPQARPLRTSILSYDEAMILSRPALTQGPAEQEIQGYQSRFDELPQGVPPQAQLPLARNLPRHASSARHSSQAPFGGPFLAQASPNKIQSEYPLAQRSSAQRPEILDLTLEQAYPVRDNIGEKDVSSLSLCQPSIQGENGPGAGLQQAASGVPDLAATLEAVAQQVEDATMNTIPAHRQRNQSIWRTPQAATGLTHSSDAAGRYGYDIPAFLPQSENSHQATRFTSQVQTGARPPYPFTAAGDSRHAVPSMSSASPALTGRAGTSRRSGTNKRRPAVSKITKRAAPSCRDDRPGLNFKRRGDDDEDGDPDNNDALANLSRFRDRRNGNGKANEGQKARQSSGQGGASKSSGPRGGEQGKKTRPDTAAQGGDGHIAKKEMVLPFIKHITYPVDGLTMAKQRSASNATTRVTAEKSADEFQAINALIQMSSGGGTPNREISDAALRPQRPQTLRSSRQDVDNAMRQIRGVAPSPPVELIDRDSHKEDEVAERKSSSLESLEKSQGNQLRKRKKQLSGVTNKDDEQPLKKRLCSGTDNDKSENERRKGNCVGKEDPEEGGDDDLIFVGARSALDGAEEYTPRTPLCPAEWGALTTDQRSSKHARSAPEPKAERSKPVPSARLSTIVNLHYTPAHLPTKLRRVFTMGLDPFKPIDSKCFLLNRVRRNEGAGHMELPLEVRQAIYRNLLVADDPIEVLHGWSEVRRWQGLALHPALLRTCARIHDEAAALLYSENIFSYVLLDDGLRIAPGRSQPWQLTLPLRQHAHHFRTLELHLQCNDIDTAYNNAIRRALWTLNLVGVDRLQKLTIVVSPHVDRDDDDRVAIASYFKSDNQVIQVLKDLRTDLIQIDVHLPKTNAEAKKSIRTVLNKRIEVDQMEVFREMDRQSGGEMWLGRAVRRRVAEAEVIRKSKAAIDEQLNRLSTRIENACTKGAAWVLRRGWFTEFEPDFVPSDDYTHWAPLDDTDDTDWDWHS